MHSGLDLTARRAFARKFDDKAFDIAMKESDRIIERAIFLLE
jgi:hypothetical protein